MSIYIGTKLPKTDLGDFYAPNDADASPEVLDAVRRDAAEDAEPEESVDAPIPLFDIPDYKRFTPTKMFNNALLIEKAFKHYRAVGFPYRMLSVAECMIELQKLAETDGANLIKTPLGYQVADTFHRHRVHAAANGMTSPFDAFSDDVKLKKAIRLKLKFGGDTRLGPTGVLSLVNGTQACSNFRPGFACYLYRKYCPEGGVVLDTSTGYGGRLLGAVASQVVSKYIGIDPNTVTHQANVQMIESLHLRELCEFELQNAPAEDVWEIPPNSCDFSFTSPPYFSKEIYSDEDTQSWKRYATWEDWLEGFLRPTMKLTHECLKSGSRAVFNVAETVKIKGKEYPLGLATVDAATKQGFVLEDILSFAMTKRMSHTTTEDTPVAVEPVYVFNKI